MSSTNRADEKLAQRTGPLTLSSLPEEILVEIFTLLPRPRAFTRTCKKFQTISKTNGYLTQWLLNHYGKGCIYPAYYYLNLRNRLVLPVLERLEKAGVVFPRNIVQDAHHSRDIDPAVSSAFVTVAEPMYGIEPNYLNKRDDLTCRYLFPDDGRLNLDEITTISNMVLKYNYVPSPDDAEEIANIWEPDGSVLDESDGVIPDIDRHRIEELKRRKEELVSELGKRGLDYSRHKAHASHVSHRRSFLAQFGRNGRLSCSAAFQKYRHEIIDSFLTAMSPVDAPVRWLHDEYSPSELVKECHAVLKKYAGDKRRYHDVEAKIWCKFPKIMREIKKRYGNGDRCFDKVQR